MEKRPAAVVVLPWPNWRLSPNRSSTRRLKKSHERRAKGHRAALRQQANQIGRECAEHLAGAIKPGEMLEAVYFFEPPTNRRYDIDNVTGALKHYVDGVASAIGFDDYQIEADHRYRMRKVKGGRVTIEFWHSADSPMFGLANSASR